METMRFEEMALSKEILKAVADMGFEEMTPIQSKTIPSIIEGRDVIGQAQTGTGKTIAFGIPVIEAVKPRSRRTQAHRPLPDQGARHPGVRGSENGSASTEKRLRCSPSTAVSP